MIKEKYLAKVKEIIVDNIIDNNIKVFIFGSSLEKEHFGDLDLGVINSLDENIIYDLKEKFEESDLPYFVDVVDFNKVSKDFKDNVFNNKILWLKQ